MEVNDKKRLQANHELLVSDLRTQDVEAFLFSRGVLSEEDCETINIRDRGITPQEAVRRLLRILKKRGGNAFSAFCEALSQDNRHILDSILATNPDEVELAEDEVDGTAALLKTLQRQLELQMRVTEQYMRDIDEYKKRAEDAEQLEAKYKELDKAMEDNGITTHDMRVILQDYSNMIKPNGLNPPPPPPRSNPVEWPLHMDATLDDTARMSVILGQDIAFYIANDFTETKPAPNKYALTLRRMAREILSKNSDNFAENLHQLRINEGNGFQTLAHIADVVFGDKPTWACISVLYTFGGWVAKFYHTNGHTQLANNVGHFMGFYMGRKLHGWMDENGGWDEFETLFGKPLQNYSELWSGILLTTVASAGIAALISLVTHKR